MKVLTISSNNIIEVEINNPITSCQPERDFHLLFLFSINDLLAISTKKKKLHK
ncbi:MAG: hypothetical protein QM532_01195 [Cyanobium sp. MAG06]|nr:hypothetical protein [Cyanobium sp. MAG06]